MLHLAIGVTRSDLSKAMTLKSVILLVVLRGKNIMTTRMKTYEINTNTHAYLISYIYIYRLVAGPHKQDKTKQKRAEQETSEVLKPQKKRSGVTTAALRYRDR